MAVSRWRYNEFTDTFNPVLIVDEVHTVEYITELNAYGFYAYESIKLDNPSTVEVVEIANPTTPFTEVSKLTAPSSGQYRVSYDASGYLNTRFIEFNSSDNGKIFNLTYYGLGSGLDIDLKVKSLSVENDINVDGDIITTGNITGNIAGLGDLLTLNKRLLYKSAWGVGVPSTITGTYAKISYGNGAWVAVASSEFMRSVNNGLTWTEPTTTANTWLDVATDGAGVWVAVSNGGVFARSTDNGSTWGSVIVTDENQKSVATDGAGVWVAVGQIGTYRITRSIDNGATWSNITSPSASTFVDVATDGAGNWVALASNGVCISSTDNGANWANATTAGTTITALYYANGRYMAIGTDGTFSKVYVSTNNGATWTEYFCCQGSWQDLAYGSGVWVAVGSGSNQSFCQFSLDNGATWEEGFIPFAMNGVYFGDDTFIAVGGSAKYARLLLSN